MLLYVLPVLSHRYGITTVRMQGAYTTGVQSNCTLCYILQVLLYYCPIATVNACEYYMYIYVACLCSMCIVST